MNGIDEAGRPIDKGRGDSVESEGILTHLDVPALRAFIISVLQAGGVPNARIAQAIRCGRAQFYRDARGADPEA